MINQIQQGLTSDQEPIIALCTPRASGALALLRLTGIGAVVVADSFARLSSEKKLQGLPTHTIHHGNIIDSNTKKVVDDVLFFLMRAPKTFTGQDTVEISCHNNQFIIETIIEYACNNGARLAQPGEFSKRAFLNGKIDLVQAEAINDLIHAQTELALRKSMEQLHGSLSHQIKSIETTLIKLLTYAEASFEFLEEEQRDLHMDTTFKDDCKKLLAHLKEIKKQQTHQQQIRNGIRIAIIGDVNAGKSTLFNVLVKKDRAIVTEIAGTTRDSVESGIYSNGAFLTFVDTAGLRTTNDFIEQQGIKRSHNEAAMADIILLVFDASYDQNKQTSPFHQTVLDSYQEKTIIVFNKTDLARSQQKETFKNIIAIEISAKNGDNIINLEQAINLKVQELFAQSKSPFLLNQRQARLIAEIELKFDFIVKTFEDVLHYELIAYHLKEVLEKTAELTGRNITEKMLDTVFNDFCVGK